MVKKINILKYLEDLSADLQCQINELARAKIKAFKGGKYTDEICTVYYEMVHINVDVKNYGDLICIVLKKLANVNIDKLSKNHNCRSRKHYCQMKIIFAL